MEEIESIAKSIAIERLFLFTEHKASFYEKPGLKTREQTPYLNPDALDSKEGADRGCRP